MSIKIFVGNLSWNTTDDTLCQVFSEYGAVLNSIVMRDRDTGRSRGFGFVTYGSEQEANAAVDGKDGTELDGRHIKVNMANSRPTGGSGYSRGGGQGGGYGGGYGGGGNYSGYSGGGSY